MTRYGMLIDLKSCNGCRACITACKCNNDIPIGEYEGREYYRIWPYEKEYGKYPYVFRNFTPFLCMHCNSPPCIDSCPISGAIYKQKGGVVLIDEKKCNGCRECIPSCPYNAIYFREDKAVVDKCTFCYELINSDSLPECVKACPSSAILFGDLDDDKSEISKQITTLKAEALYPQYGTEPSVYYTKHAGRVKGITWDSTINKPVSNIIITLKELDTSKSFSTISDDDGIFFFWSLEIGKKYEITMTSNEKYTYHRSEILIENEYVELGKIHVKNI
jgi:Fe-S-cluster-containing dehydrogenase component